MAFTNKAAWLSTNNKIEVGDAPYTLPGDDEILVQNAAVAVNPFDFTLLEARSLITPWIQLPFILGSDVAGTVVGIGANVTRFKRGERVLGMAVGNDKRCNRSSHGAFQQYTILRTNLTSHIPDSISFERACVVPVGLSTATCGLFMKDYLALDLPTAQTFRKRKGKTVLIWGGSTSVGCNAIQLATAAGYDVITTASPRNHDLLKKLGAVQVFDYNSATVVSDIVSAFQGRECAGAFSIGDGAFKACITIVSAVKGRNFVAQATIDKPSGDFPQTILQWPSFLTKYGAMKASELLLKKRKGVDTNFIWASDVIADEVGKAIYQDFLPLALENGSFVPAPEPLIVGNGLETIAAALGRCKQGVSAQKVVVKL